MAFGTITAANFAAAAKGTPLPGSFMATHPTTTTAAPAPKPAAKSSPAPTPSPTVSYTSNNSSTTSAAQVAAAKAAADQARAEANFQNEQTATNNTINTGIGSGAGDYNQSILDAFNGSGGFKSQQSSIDSERTQNELSRLEGVQGVRDMVNNGINGGGVVLDNAGAGTSSAGEALARAYGVEGRQQASKVGQQAAQGNSQIDTEQNNLSGAEDNFQNVDMPTKKADIINGIVSSANQALTYLAAISSSANLPDQINIAQQMADIKARATAALSAYDGELQTARGGAAALSPDAFKAKAASLFASGTAPQKEFNFSSEVPAELQNTGPAASSLPIYAPQPNKNDSGLTQ